MKYAITAASGRLGTEILKELIKKVGKENVIGITKSPHKLREFGIELRFGDYNSPAEMKEAFRGINSIIMISSDEVPQKRIQQHQNLLLSAYKAGVKKVVFTSLYGDEPSSSFRHLINSFLNEFISVSEIDEISPKAFSTNNFKSILLSCFY